MMTALDLELFHQNLARGELGACERTLMDHPHAVHERLDKVGNTALHLAASLAPEYRVLDLCDLLIVRGAFINARNDANFTPLVLCLGRSNVAESLILRGADVECTSSDHPSVRSLLHRAVEKSSEGVIRMILERGGPGLLERKGPGGERALHEAVKHGSVSTVLLLLRAGAQADALDDRGRSPAQVLQFHTQQLHTMKKMCFALISHGADPAKTLPELQDFTMEMAAAAGNDVQRLSDLWRLREAAHRPITTDEMNRAMQAARAHRAMDTEQFLESVAASRAIDAIVAPSPLQRPF
jgi:ankyrin repeat protein